MESTLTMARGEEPDPEGQAVHDRPDAVSRTVSAPYRCDFRADYGTSSNRHSTPNAATRPMRGGGAARVVVERLSDSCPSVPRERFNQLRQDVTYALRGMRRDPGFVAVARFSPCALGTGVDAAIFSIVHAVLLPSRCLMASPSGWSA